MGHVQKVNMFHRCFKTGSLAFRRIVLETFLESKILTKLFLSTQLSKSSLSDRAWWSAMCAVCGTLNIARSHKVHVQRCFHVQSQWKFGQTARVFADHGDCSYRFKHEYSYMNIKIGSVNIFIHWLIFMKIAMMSPSCLFSNFPCISLSPILSISTFSRGRG